MSSDTDRYIRLIRSTLTQDYNRMFREPGGPFLHPFLTPGSQYYDDVLWDWDSWLSNVALRQILQMCNDPGMLETARRYEQGCVLNFLKWTGVDGWMPISVARTDPVADLKPADPYASNMHKPVLAQHAAFLVQQDGDSEWLRETMLNLEAFLANYRNHHRHQCGLYFWQTDERIGVDNDPCTFFRPPRSSGSIYLNSLMYRELLATAFLCRKLNLDEIALHYEDDARALHSAIQEHCWDERDGFFYSVDLNLLPREGVKGLHANQPRHWDCLIQRIGVWSGFLPMWADIATPDQAERIVVEHFRNTSTFNAPYGVRTLSKMEKMYQLRGSGNPSCWLGPVWGVSNYLTFRGLARYGFQKEARELAEKTIRLFGRDLERFGALHEYYQPENGEPILSRGFQNWNYLVLNMIEWMEGKEAVTEF
ncbi:MAG: MGH1-like glycoside hydrolase domain-containing protein [Candidatus Sumerlaeaceae bacterium]